MKFNKIFIFTLVAIIGCSDENSSSLPNSGSSSVSDNAPFLSIQFAENIQKFIAANDGIYFNNSQNKACHPFEIKLSDAIITSEFINHSVNLEYFDSDDRFFHDITFVAFSNSQYTYFFNLVLFVDNFRLLNGTYEPLIRGCAVGQFYCSYANSLEVFVYNKLTGHYEVFVYVNVITTISTDSDNLIHVNLKSNRLQLVNSFFYNNNNTFPVNVSFNADFCLNLYN
ncbi:MAG: hypothetical protein O9340_08340 [Cyclobacteriaceae bacterium]|jgi:hypothetical protein|nr:hypothetical protein [Cyclobacteriaceae bacterium]